jgi:hypothetical protein
VYVYMCVYMYVCVFMSIYVCMYMHVYMYIKYYGGATVGMRYTHMYIYSGIYIFIEL